MAFNPGALLSGAAIGAAPTNTASSAAATIGNQGALGGTYGAVQGAPISSPGSIDTSGSGAANGAANGAAYSTPAPAPVGDPNLAAQYADEAGQLQYQLGLLDPQYNTGMSNIGNSYNTQDNRLTQDQAQAQAQYDLQGQQNTSNYGSARNNALTQTRSANSALQRLLGMNGAGNSSAALEAAPYAAALQGSQLINGAQHTYGQNQQNLDFNWQGTTQKFKNAKDDLNQQRYAQENGLKSSIDQSRASLLDKISQANINHDLALGQNYTQAQAAQGGLTSQIHDLLSQIANLGSQYANPVLTAQNVQYTPTQLANYNFDKIGAPTGQGANPGTSDINPTFLSMLSGANKRDQFGNPITA